MDGIDLYIRFLVEGYDGYSFDMDAVIRLIIRKLKCSRSHAEELVKKFLKS
jgi:hypothetical protein